MDRIEESDVAGGQSKCLGDLGRLLTFKSQEIQLSI